MVGEEAAAPAAGDVFLGDHNRKNIDCEGREMEEMAPIFAAIGEADLVKKTTRRRRPVDSLQSRKGEY